MQYSLNVLRELMADRRVRGLSVRRELQPLGGPGDLVSPPTFAQGQGQEKGPRYVWSKRRLADEEVDTCLLDSPASQANRMEEAISRLLAEEAERDEPRLELPLHRLDVPHVGTLTDLDLPHRTYDAAVGTATMADGSKWNKSDIAKAIRLASRKEAAALLEHAPMLLVLGGWDSHSYQAANAWQGRHEKAVWSKVVAIDAFKMNRPGGRLDPMGLPSSAKVDLGDGDKKLSEQGLGVVPASIEQYPRLSISMRHAEQRSVVSFGVLRQLAFGSPEKDQAARTLLGALGILCVAALHEDGGHLRSECDLVCEHSDGWKVRVDGAPDQPLEGVEVESALDVVSAALRAVRRAGLAYRTEPVELQVHEALVAAMGRSEA